jgi:hypothetical protein
VRVRRSLNRIWRRYRDTRPDANPDQLRSAKEHGILISTRLSSASAVLLIAGGVVLLFIPDVILPRLMPEIPTSAAWLGQCIGAGWLAVGALNWLSRGSVLGGIYGRPVVVANAALYFITAMVLIRLAADRADAAAFWVAALPAVLLAGVYGWLLLRGPIESDLRGGARPA